MPPFYSRAQACFPRRGANITKCLLEPDPDLRDTESVPLGEDIYEYFKREVIPHVSDAWISQEKKYRDHKDGQIGKIGYEISFTRYFYEYKPLRPLEEISGEIKKLEDEIAGMLTDL